MSSYDLIIRGGTAVEPGGERAADLAVADGKIAAVEPDIADTASEEVDARGLHVLPGVIDAHVHFNEPGRTEWEGLETGSSALAAGGMTSFVEMPLNAYPPTNDAEAFEEKVALARASAVTDFAFYGGLMPGSLGNMEELAERGVAGFKAFMSTSGTLDFQTADDVTLYEGMQKAAALGLPVLVHAESKQITDELSARRVSTLRTTMRDYLDSRPVVAELEAIQRAILFAGETGCALHVVHVSTGRGVALVAEARERGVDVTCETCAHYLVLTEEDAEALGAVTKCAPPLRPQEEVESLWVQISAGNVEFVTSDHSPCPPHMKAGDDMFRAWGGISGCQSLMNVMLDEGHHGRGVSLQKISGLLSGGVASRLGFPEKGALEAGLDADLALVDLDGISTLHKEDLLYRHKMSPYVGRAFTGEVVRTLVRGNTVYREGRVVSDAIGELVKPERRTARAVSGE
ncbi:allantoinase AllB [Rubrobacter aplysinae]|uniref:allantoinase AllB n=1 Tax=Rubrobacter aplysinae TaxID=909625 RepID=UPI00064C071F|nr:allantoinase AllB [Rubrobacter aplysinae]